MEISSAEEKHAPVGVGVHKKTAAPSFPPDKEASEDSKADLSLTIFASELDLSQGKQEASRDSIVDHFSGERASEYSKDDSSPEKNARVLLPEQQNQAVQKIGLLAGNHAPDLISKELQLSEKAGGVGLVMGRLGANGHLSAVVPKVDTAAPSESVKAAVTLCEEKMDQKSQAQVLDNEKKSDPGFDGEKANDDNVLYEKLLHEEETSIAEVLLELEKAKEQIQVHKVRIPGTEEAFSPSHQPEEVLNAKDTYMSVLHELEMARKEIEGVNEERARQESLKQVDHEECEAAFRARDAATERLNQLMAEQASSQEALAAAQATRAAIESEIWALRSGSGVELEGKASSKLVQDPNTNLARLTSLELDIGEVNSMVAKLKEELATRNAHSKASSTAHTSEAELTTAMNEELKQAKVAEGEGVVAIGRVLEELDVMKASLTKATQDGASLTAAIAGLQAEVATRQAELESAHETEQIACATLASLQDELCSIRALVLSAHAEETKAREAKRTFPTEIKQLASAADEAKVASRLARKEARKSALELELSKASTTTAVSRLQAALKDTEAARASEAMAVANFKALSESVGEEHASKEGSEGKEGAVNISIEEYKSLTDAGHEAEEAANKKVSAVLGEVEAAQAREKGAQAKLDASMEEIEALQKAMEEVEKKADDAQAAKLSVEAELRKWRAEHEQWRKTGSNPSSVNTSAAQSPRVNTKVRSQGKVVAHASFHGKTARSMDSLAEVLSLKVPAVEKIVQDIPEVVDIVKKVEKAKKPSFFMRVMSMIVRKKSSSARYSSNT